MKNPNLNPENQNSAQLDPQVEEALRNFRLSMRNWSDSELTSRPASALNPARHSAWHWLMAPAVTWGAAAALAIAAVGVPLGVHHHNVVIAEQAAVERQHKTQEMQETAPTQVANSTIDDDKLLEHVDADISQQTPDAMQPLVSLAKDSGAE